MASYRYTLHPHERQRVDGYFRPGMHAGFLKERDDFGSWTVYREHSDFVEMRHYNGAVMRVVIADGRAMSYELFEGEAAQQLEAEWKAFLAKGQREGRQAAVLGKRQYESRDKLYQDQAAAGCAFVSGVQLNCGFVRCDLSGADLGDITLNECGFDGGSLRAAKLARATVRSSVFNGVDASGLLVDAARFEGCVFRQGTLTGIAGKSVTFSRCRFEGTSFQNSRLVEAKLEQCKCEGCDFTGTDWTGIDTTLAVFEGCCGGPGGKNDRNPVQRRVPRFFQLATALVLAADGELERDERLAVAQKLGEDAADFVSIAAELPDDARKELGAAAQELTRECPTPERHKLLEELCVYANVSGGVSDSERAVLVECARLLELPPDAVDAALTRHLDLD